MNKKNIAKHALGFIGGTPTVNRYNNDIGNKQIDVMCCERTMLSTTNVYATIGLSEIDGGVISDHNSVRIELIGIAPSNSDYMGNVVASTAFEIIDRGFFGYGDIIQNVVGNYVSNTTLKHIVLVAPRLWDKFVPYIEDNTHVTWLMILPITDQEMEFIFSNGIDAFEEKLTRSEFDICNLYRDSLVR